MLGCGFGLSNCRLGAFRTLLRHGIYKVDVKLGCQWYSNKELAVLRTYIFYHEPTYDDNQHTRPFHVSLQGGSSDSFPECRNAATLAAMAASYTDMVFTASLWGGGGIDMGWLDGMTGCGGECDIDSASVTMTNFELWE